MGPLGIGLGIMAMQRPLAATLPGLAPFFDTFDGDGALNVRVGWAGATTSATAANIGGLSTLSSAARSTFANSGIHVYHDSGAGAGASRGWAKLTEAGNTGAGGNDAFEAHVTVDPTANQTAISIAANPNATLVNQTVFVGGTATQAWAAQCTYQGVVVEHRTINDAGTMRLQMLLNGRRATITAGSAKPAAGADIATLLGRAPNGRYGFSGRLSNPAVRMFGTSNDAVEAWITVYSAGYIRQAGQSLYLSGEYWSPNGVAPTAAQMSASIYDAASNSETTPLTGQGDLPFSNFQASGGKWSGTIAVNPTDASYAIVKWNWGSGFATYPTATIKTGLVIALEGQSQVGFWTSNLVDSGTAPVPTSLPVLSMASDSGIEVGTRNLKLTPAINTAYSAMVGAIQGYSAQPVLLLNIALGGTPYSTRLAEGPVQAGGTNHFTAMTEALETYGGGRPAIIVMAGGTSSEADTAYSGSGDDQATHVRKHMIAMADQIDARFGKPMLYGVSPEGNELYAGIGNPEAKRRAMYQLTVDFPARFKLVAWRHDMQHVYNGSSIDPDHYGDPANPSWVAGSSQGGGEFARRVGRGIALALGLTTENYLGPKMTGATRVDANNIDVVYNIGSFTAIEVANTAFAGDYQGGHRFGTTNAFGTLLTPDSATVTGNIIRYHFAAALPGQVYISGPTGDNPFNRANTSAVNIGFHTKASMVRATKAGMLPSALQPSYNVGGPGVDYLTI